MKKIQTFLIVFSTYSDKFSKTHFSNQKPIPVLKVSESKLKKIECCIVNPYLKFYQIIIGKFSVRERLPIDNSKFSNIKKVNNILGFLIISIK